MFFKRMGTIHEERESFLRQSAESIREMSHFRSPDLNNESVNLVQRRSTMRHARNSSLQMQEQGLKFESRNSINLYDIMDEIDDLGLQNVYVTLHRLTGIPAGVAESGYQVKLAYGCVNKNTLLFYERDVMQTMMEDLDDDKKRQ